MTTAPPASSLPPALAAPPAVFLSALRRVLRPLVRLLIQTGVTFPALSQILKQLYVEVAEHAFTLPGRSQSDSRISVLTGVHRKEIKRLREDEDRTPPAVSLGAEVIGRWLSGPPYLDEAGGPRPLPRAAEDGAVSFESLVQSISTDVRPRVLFDEWLASGIIRPLPDGRLELVTEAFVPRGDFAQLAHFFGRNLRDHVAAAAHNLIAQGPPFFERAMFHDGLSADSIAALSTEAERAGMATLVALNRHAHELAAGDARRSDANQRITVGIYLYAAPRPDPSGFTEVDP
ncbi:MAG: hypothetical protein GC191_11250 [Azospirillum sp.]|nr:hypothetical protein [Azospirillum sp.]